MNLISVPPAMNAMAMYEPETIKASRKVMESPVRIQENNKEAIMLPLNEPITKYSARLIRKQLLAGGRKLNKADRRYLKHMIDYGKLLDGESFHILLNLLLSAPQE